MWWHRVLRVVACTYAHTHTLTCKRSDAVRHVGNNDENKKSVFCSLNFNTQFTILNVCDFCMYFFLPFSAVIGGRRFSQRHFSLTACVCMCVLCINDAYAWIHCLASSHVLQYVCSVAAVYYCCVWRARSLAMTMMMMLLNDDAREGATSKCVCVSVMCCECECRVV